MLGLGAAIGGVARAYKAARARNNTDVSNACFCYLLAMVGFLVSITFLSNAYSVNVLVMVGLGISLSVAAGRQLSAKSVPAPLMPAVRY